METPTITFLTTAFLTTAFLTAVWENTLSGWRGEFVTACSGLAAIVAQRLQKNYADVSKKLLHNRFKLLD